MNNVNQNYAGLALGLCLNRNCAAWKGLLIEDETDPSCFCPYCRAGVIHSCPNPDCNRTLEELGFSFELLFQPSEWPNYCRFCNERLYLTDGAESGASAII